MKRPISKKREPIRSQLPVRLTLRGSNYELAVEAPASRIMRDLGELKRLADNVGRTLFGIPVARVSVPGPEVTFEEAPAIKSSKSTKDNLQALFETGWGRKARTVADAVKALEANAVPDTTTSVAVYLNRLVKKGVLRRIRRGGKWHYYRLPSS